MKSNSKKKSILKKILKIFFYAILVLIAFALISSDSHTFKKLLVRNITGAPQSSYKLADVGKIEKFELVIEKLEIDVPVVANVDGKNESLYDEALQNGVAHYKGTALPGSGSNIMIFGHSSTVSGEGKYAEIFSKLNLLKENDKIEIRFNDKIYNYQVIKKYVTKASDLDILKPTPKEQLTLMTCWPVGSDRQRLVVIAEKV